MVLIQDIIHSNYHYQPSWVMVLIVLSVMIIGFLFSAFYTRLLAVVKAFFISRFAEQLFREEHSLSHPASVLLSLNFLITSSLFLLQVISSKGYFSGSLQLSFVSLLIVTGSIFIIYLVKIMTLKILGFIFDDPAVANEYIFLIFLVNQIIGIGFIPVIIFIAYGQQAFINVPIYIGILLFILGFIIKIGRGIMTILSGQQMALVYLFFYLCTFEILPLLLGWKLIEKLS